MARSRCVVAGAVVIVLLLTTPAFGKKLQPSWKTVRVIQDKYLQKAHLMEAGVGSAESLAVSLNTPECLAEIGSKLGYPFMLKARTLAYDGRGNYVVSGPEDIPAALGVLGAQVLYAERWATFTKELAVMVVRTQSGDCISYPTVETVHEGSICKLVFAPARVPAGIAEKARRLAERAVASFWGAGVFGVEMFLLKDGKDCTPTHSPALTCMHHFPLTPGAGSLLVNELAPRPHNSGHYTIEACPTSQYEAHLRAITGLPLYRHSTSLATPSTNAIMLNLLGPGALRIARRSLSIKGATVHLYGKAEAKVGRKMGHVTVVAGSMSEAEFRIDPLIRLADQEKRGASPATAIAAADAAIITAPTTAGAAATEQPVVAIIMGSDSDLPVMKAGAEILRRFGVCFHVTIVSAHRTPDRMSTFAKEARARGLKVIIAGAGGAAHLPGMVAAMCTLPVIGVPVRGSVLDGVDSLHSIVQMPVRSLAL